MTIEEIKQQIANAEVGAWREIKGIALTGPEVCGYKTLDSLIKRIKQINDEINRKVTAWERAAGLDK